MDFIFEFLAFSFLLILDFALKCGIQNRNQNVKPADDDNDESQNDNSDNEWDIVNEKEVSENPIHEISKVVSIKFEKNKECLVIDFLLVDGSTLSADYIEYDINEVLPKFSVKTKVNIDGDRYLLASLIPGILFDLQELTIWNQKLTMEEFQEVASSSSIKFLNIQSTKITESEGSLVTVDKIISNQHNLEDIHIDCSPSNVSFTPNTVSKMVVTLHRLKNLQHFHLSGITDNFKFSAIINFLMKNQTVDVFLVFDQFYKFSDAYKKEIEYFMNLAIKNPPKKKPIIEFPGIYQTEIYQKYELL